MTHRAVEVLSSAALIIAEDTRHSRRLLDHYKISTPLKSYHEHNEAQETPRLVARLRTGDSIALISDAGTPLISDPGSRLVVAAVEANLPVVPIPGASSVMAAIVGSGMALERFTFVGFLPRKGRERTDLIADVVASHSTVVMFEAANRVGGTLEALADAGAADRPAVVARELTKQFEEFKRGTVSELAALYEEVDPKGEVVLVIAGAEKATVSESELSDAARKLRASGNSPRDVMEHLMTGLGAPRNVAYKLAHETGS
ncbi:MAG: rRNA (cytidine1402-2-O)-methyltransferase [Gemmatimonadaceae bacterium]|jgi:16S rRNA (cytidine1402-2'-O)-methyltransferase|nr:rRNA (cytidine1402-2-O)-methyltransferase [Gemmatimonadaceae bacterium]